LKEKFNQDGGKGGRLFGDALTEEALDSSDSILSKHRSSFKGLQQFFSPPEASQLIHEVFGDIPVLDLTAGAGNLIEAFPEIYRFGVEIDQDQIQAGKYIAIHADIQKLFPLMKLANIKVPLIAINPPFGLTWHDPAFSDKQDNGIGSTLLTFLYSLELLQNYGAHGVLIAGQERFYREIMSRSEAKNFYYIIKVSDLFTNADIPSVIAFYYCQAIGDYWQANFPLEVESTKQDLLSHASLIRSLIERHSSAIYKISFVSEYEVLKLQQDFATLQSEYNRRYRSKKKEAQYALSTNGTEIKVGLTAFQQLALAQKGQLRVIELLDRQSIRVLMLNTQDLHLVAQLEREGCITVDPKLKEKIDELLEEVERQKCPLYPIKPQQRLGFLSDVSEIKCVKSDPAKELNAGQSYPIYTRSVIQQHRYTEENTDSKGNIVEKEKLQERRVLQIAIGEGGNINIFNESPEDMEYLLSHFEIPDPGDIGTRFPEQYQHALATVKEIEREYGTKYNWKFKQFQKDDLARLIMKGSGILAWEMGLGKL